MPRGLAAWLWAHKLETYLSHTSYLGITGDQRVPSITHYSQMQKIKCTTFLLNFDENPCCSKSRFPIKVSISLVKEMRSD